MHAIEEANGGGLVVLSDGAGCPLRLLAIPSSEVGDDHTYRLPPELFTSGSLAFWHNHAFNPEQLPYDVLDNNSAAHPSGTTAGSLATVWGDRWISWLRGIDGLVFAPTGKGTFSVVFYDSEDEEIDMGRHGDR